MGATRFPILYLLSLRYFHVLLFIFVLPVQCSGICYYFAYPKIIVDSWLRILGMVAYSFTQIFKFLYMKNRALIDEK